jgi:hypothetical protein
LKQFDGIDSSYAFQVSPWAKTLFAVAVQLPAGA